MPKWFCFTPLPNIHNTKVVSTPMIKRKTICAVALTVTFIILSFTLSGCNTNNKKPECQRIIGGPYSGEINMYIIPPDGETASVSSLEIVDEGNGRPASQVKYSTTIMEDGVAKIHFSSPREGPINCERKLNNHDRFAAYFTLHYGVSESRFKCTYELVLCDRPYPFVCNGAMRLIEVSRGDIVYIRGSADEASSVEDIDIKLRLRDNKLEPIKP